jgi:hypothetical protein
MLARHMAGLIFEGAIAARADAVPDAVLDLRYLAAGSRRTPLGGLALLPQLLDPVVLIGDLLSEPVTLSAQPIGLRPPSRKCIEWP